ncbi:MAG: hypothetical protein FWG80_04045 [Alphaproteobacteria bacterium]|nr:hypothetical protein [Alphaproteobacteria bacterium]
MSNEYEKSDAMKIQELEKEIKQWKTLYKNLRVEYIKLINERFYGK